MTIVEIPREMGTGWWQWRERVKRDPCPYCAIKPPRRLRTIEHVEPQSRGGADEPENIVGACGPCNWHRNDTPLLLWLLQRQEEAC